MSYINTFSTSGPICPYCGHQNEGIEDELTRSDQIPFDCRGCGEEFLAEVTIFTEYHYESKKIEADNG